MDQICLAVLWLTQPFAGVTVIDLNDPPAIRPPTMPHRRTTECHPERLRKERR
jgi:hypothetical protein